MWLTALLSTWLAATLPQATVIQDGWDAAEETLGGRIVDESGRPVAGAAVSLRTRVPGESVARGDALTDADGRFLIQVAPRPSDGVMYRSFLEVTGAGFATSHLERVYLPPPAYDVGPIVLYRPVELRGRVTSADGRPVAGAEIHAALGEAVAPHGDHARRAPVAITDTDGAYVCKSLPPGRVTLGASAPGFADCVLDVRELAASTNQVDFTLAPERIVRVRVSGSDGRALVDAVAEPLGDLWGPAPYRKQEHYLAFWRGAARADASGCIVLRGLAAASGDVRVSARDRRPALIALDATEARAELDPVQWIDVTAVCDGGERPEIYQLSVRDTTREPSWCGNCDDNRIARLWSDSPAVERLAADRWRVAWNSPSIYVDGGRPGGLNVVTTAGGHGSVELPAASAPGSTHSCTVRIDASARLSGVVRTKEGAPVALRLGVQLSLYRSDWLAVTSDASGRFDFDRIASGPKWMYSLDDHWEIEGGEPRIELAAGEQRTGFELTVRARPDGRSGSVRGRLLVDGAPPGEPMLLALDEVPDQHLPDAYPRALVWTDREGNFEVSSFWPRAYHILAKHRPPSPGGGWRDFASEFPAHDSRWEWKVYLPDSGVTEDVVIDLPAESRWDAIAPPGDDDR